jgi:hypothetical protein
MSTTVSQILLFFVLFLFSFFSFLFSFFCSPTKAEQQKAEAHQNGRNFCVVIWFDFSHVHSSFRSVLTVFQCAQEGQDIEQSQFGLLFVSVLPNV